MASRIERKVEELNEQISEMVSELADQYREQTLVPFCRRHRFTFLSGNGSWSFYRFDPSHPGGHGDVVDHEDNKAVQQIEDRLALEVFGNVSLGHYMQDVSRKDIGL